MMNKRVKKLWVKALKSEKYRQGVERLKMGNFFCCLGVLCDLHAKETGNNWSNGGRYFGERGGLPHEVVVWAEVSHCDPIIGGFSATSLNDEEEKNFEQIAIPEESLGGAKNYLTENLECEVLMWNNRPVSVDVPTFVEMEIVECDPGLRGDTVSGATKPAKMLTGYRLQVPLFVEQGEWIRIDTRTGAYLERVKK